MKNTLIITITLISLIACEKQGVKLDERILKPDFSFEVSSSTGEVKFTNLTSKAKGISGEAYHWDLGDGYQHTAEHPIHYYKSNGTYTVTMTVHHKDYEKSVKKDLSVFIKNGSGNGGGNNGGGDPIVKNGTVMFWTTFKTHLGASVYIDGSYVGKITKYYEMSIPYYSSDKDPNAVYGSQNLPPCGTDGMVTTSKPLGNYKYTTSIEGLSGKLVISSTGGCTWIRLY